MPGKQKSTTEWATIGKIVAPFGLHGEMKVFPLTDIPGRFSQLKAIYLSPDYARYKIEGVRPYKGDMLLLALESIEDATAVEPLRKRDICIPLDQLAKLPSDSYYQHDILGLHVHTLANQEVGIIVDIMTTGGNDVYILRSGDNREISIPAIKEVVKQIDLVRRMMYIEPIKGLLDDDAIIDDPNSSEGDATV